MFQYLKANWPAPNHVIALSTTRDGGVSLPPYDSNNLALHVDDNATHVQMNRQRLQKQFNLTAEPAWLSQTHSNHCVIVEEDDNRVADASITRQPNRALAILTADCVPIVLCNQEGTEIAAIHAGWRGLANHIIEKTLDKMQAQPETLMAWVGPCICEQCYETGDSLQKTFVEVYPYTDTAFHIQNNRIHTNLPLIAELVLKQCGVPFVYQSGQCTFEPLHCNDTKNKYFSYRQQQKTGRIVTMVWFNNPDRTSK